MSRSHAPSVRTPRGRVATAATLALAVTLGGLAAAPAAQARVLAGDGSGTSDPAWSVPVEDLEAAIECSDLTDEVGRDHEPVLLVHGTGTWGYEQYHWSYSALLDRLGIDWCTVTYPDRGLGDQQVSAEYVAYAIERVHEWTGSAVDVVGHSQGAVLPRWAVKYWPGARAATDDMVLQAPPSHGTTVANPLALGYESGPRPPAAWQFLPESDFVRTLNARDETPGDVDYTVLWTEYDELVQPSYGPSPTAPLEGGVDGPHLTNTKLQDVCPGRMVDHLTIGTSDRVAAALTLAALTLDGPLDPGSVADLDLCAGPDEAAVFAGGADAMEEATGLPFGAAYRAIAGAFPDFFQRQESMTTFFDVMGREQERGFTQPASVDREPEIAPYARADRDAVAPRPASEGFVTDACRQTTQDDPKQPCDLPLKVTHALALACRDVTAEREDCRWLNGQPVGSAQVDAYLDGWVAQAHALQRDLGDDLELRDSVFVATHNSYNGYGYTPTLSRLDANQTYSIYDQLRMDARRVEIDVHWWYSPEHPEGVPVTCHATSLHDGTPPSRHVGCTTEDTLDVALADVRAFLDDPASGDDVIMVRFETHLENASNHGVAAQMIEAALGDDLYRPAGAGCAALPLELTRDAVRAAGKRVIAVGGCGDGDAAWTGAVFSDDGVRTEETHRGEAYAYPSCGGHARPADDDWYATRWVRRYEDATLVSSWTSLGGDEPRRVTPALAREWVRCGVNQPSFDHLTPTDGRLEAMVWSLHEADFEAPAGDCAVAGADGRLTSSGCIDLAPVVCGSGAYGDFELSRTRVVAAAAVGACKALGMAPAVPRTGYEAMRVGELVAAAGVDGAWVDLTRADGRWQRG